MILTEKHSFEGGMDSDTNERMLAPNTLLNLMNGRVVVSQYGRMLRVENVPGTLLISQNVYPPYGTNQTIGSAVDLDSGRLLWFVYNTFSDHGIYCYDPTLKTTFAVLYDSQVIGGLNFNRSTLIHSARVENGCLYWVNGTTNEPFRIDINAGIEMNKAGTFPTVTPYQYPMSKSVIYWIRKQPALPLTAAKNDDTNFDNNFIKNEAFQFYWRYIYRNYEVSTLSAASTLINYNNSAETDNSIIITAPLGETIQQDVLQVDFVAKYLNSNKYFVIHSWNITIPADEQAIYNHNHASTPLTFTFYNDFLGIALDDAYAAKPYDSVPIYAQTIEMARFRSFMANYTIGYTTPTATSLNATGHESTDGTLTMQWVLIQYSGGNHYFLYSNSFGFFDVGPQPSPPPYPTTVAYGTMTNVADGPADFALYLLANYSGWFGGIQWQPDTATITGGPPVPGLNGKVAFKSGASYQLSIEFLDHSGRKCGILTSSSLKVNIPQRSYDQIDYTTAIAWSLSNTNALVEIPDWAYYYSINITKCLTTRFFLQARGKNITYATKQVSDGTYIYNTTTYATTLNGVAIDITSLNAFGIGYTFTDGDLVKVYINGDSTVYNLSIVAQDGNWIVCELQDLGTLGNTASPKTDFLFEIYTPYKPSTSEPSFEVAQIYPVTNPTTNTRSYSTLAGDIGGDITLLTRNDGTNDYLTENMSPNDKFYFQWNTDSGRPNFIDTIGQVTKTNTISYSNTIIQGSRTNGLSTFDALDTKDVPDDCGSINKLQSADKVAQEQGSIMLAICRNRTASCYLSEVQLVGASSNAFVAQAADVIGTINILKGPYGTINPESVFNYLGLVFWADVLNNYIIQYADDGLTTVSQYKQTRFFKNYLAAYYNASTGNLDNINGFHHIRMNVNPFTKEILVTLPSLIYENYADTLPSYTSVPSYATSIINRFDIYDQLGKTMSFLYEENRWGHNYEALSEWSENLNGNLYQWKNGDLYIADGDVNNFNKFFGVNYPVRICGTANINPSQLKDLSNIAVESTAAPDWAVAMTNIPNVQITDLAGTDVGGFTDQQGIYYGSWLRDRLSPNASGIPDQKLYIGDVLVDISIFWMLEFQQYQNLFFCNFVNIGWETARGQSAISNPINR